MLAAARAHQAGIDGAHEILERVYGVIDEHFWEPAHGLCADEATPEWELSSYRGINANMHTCEALIAAHEATGRNRFLERATTIAATVTRELAEDDTGRIWEHYTDEWRADLEYNREEPAHQFLPWGYQPGHHVEWAKLLCLIYAHDPKDCYIQRATELFDIAVNIGWDVEHDGFYYTTDPDGETVVADKYGWAHAEGIGATALLSVHDESYLDWYDRLWRYVATHFAIHATVTGMNDSPATTSGMGRTAASPWNLAIIP